MNFRYIFFFCFFLLIGSCRQASDKANNQPGRFENEISTFEKADIQSGSKLIDVLFTGSSSIRLWASLEDDMSPMQVLNRGFGGATLAELSKYAPRFLLSHSYSTLVVYCGENDISEGAGPDTTYQYFVDFYNWFREERPQVHLVYMSMKPSIDRWDMFSEFKATDRKIKKVIEKDTLAYYFDSSIGLLNNSGQPDPDLFIEDGLHMNSKGYNVWTQRLLALLQKLD